MLPTLMTFTSAPLLGIFYGFDSFFYSLGKSRVTSELVKMGYKEKTMNIILNNVKNYK